MFQRSFKSCFGPSPSRAGSKMVELRYRASRKGKEGRRMDVGGHRAARTRRGAPTHRAARRRVQVMAPMFQSPFRSPIRGRCSLLLMGVGLGEDSCPKVFDRSRLTPGSGGVEPLTGSRTEKESSARRQNYDARASVRSWVRRPKVQQQEQQHVNGHDPLSHREDFEIAVEAPTTTGLPVLDTPVTNTDASLGI